MQKKTVLAAAFLAGSIAMPALAGQPPVIPAPPSCPIHGSVSLGYINNYEYRGLVATDDLAENGGLVYGANLYYQTRWNFKLVADLTFRDIEFTNFNDAFTNRIGSRDTTSKQTNLFVGASKSYFADVLTTTLGYNFTRGGLPGLAAINDNFDGTGSDQTHEIWGGATFNFGELIGAPGLFYQLSSSYCFSGNVGWWLGNTVGFERDINDCVKYVIALNASSSYSYWANGTDGWDQVNLSFALPIAPNNNFEIAPYISLNWGAHNVQSINSYARQFDVLGVNALENFAIVAGVKATYNF